MNSPADFQVRRNVELLADLKQRVAEFAEQEEKLTREFASRRNAAARRQRDDRQRTETALADQLQATEAYYLSEETRVRAVYDHRRAQIERAQSNCNRTLQSRARKAKDKKLGALQMEHLQAERALPANLKRVDEAASAFAAKLAEQDALLLSLESRARKAFAGSTAYAKATAAAAASGIPETADNPESLFRQLQQTLGYADAELDGFRGNVLPRLFAIMPVALAIALIVIAGAVGAFLGGFSPTAVQMAGAGVGVGSLVFAAMHFIAVRQSREPANSLATAFATARTLREQCATAATARHEQERQQIQAEYDQIYARINQEWSVAGEIETNFAKSGRHKINNQVMRLLGRHERTLGPRLQQLPPERESRLADLRAQGEADLRSISDTFAAETAKIDEEEAARWRALEDRWNSEVLPRYREVEAANAASSAHFPEWTAEYVANWQPAAEFATAARIGKLELDLSGALPKSSRLTLPGPGAISLPVALTFPDKGSLLFETSDTGDATVIGTINNAILRLFASSPAGKLSFTIIDPIGLGQNFAGLMHLADYEESLIDRRIWTQRDQIEERLQELNEHIEKVIQMYLRDEFATISDYNAQAGSVAEKYHFLVIADFPGNFSETAAKRLQSIAVSGPRCGVFTLIHWDRRHPAPDGLVSEELRNSALWIRRENGQLVASDFQAKAGISLVFDPMPEPQLAASLIHKIGQTSVDSNRVEVPFSQIAPVPDALWKCETTGELRVAIGRTGATKLQYLSIGKGTRQHALFAGKTGSGKSTLFHVIITNLALSCSPDEVEFYLIDFKKGVEFKCYASKRLPHARVVAIESDREFALSVLQRVDEELKRRGDIFRKLGVQDIPGYKRAGGTEPMPRSLLIIDEFQEFFVEDDAVAQSASMLFDRIVRQGRAFGIHVLLGSQTLGGAYTLARATIGQMVIRVALQCNEADAYLIMDDNNPAPRLLSRPGEGIYNDAAGAVEGNSPFQVVWLGDEERDEHLERIHELAVAEGLGDRHPVVFEGNAPADIADNGLLEAALKQAPTRLTHAPRCWLGAPNSIKGPTEAVFHRQSGNNMLIVGQREESALSLILLSMLALAAQHPAGTAKFALLHSSLPDSSDAELIEQVAGLIPHPVRLARGPDVPAMMNELAADLKERSAGGDASASAPSTYVFIHGIQKHKKLRQDDDFSFSMSSDDEGGNPAAQFTELTTEGSGHGIHLIVTVDTFNNVNRTMNRKALSEFEMRVLFQMSANDSASLIDSPKASGLGLHRALFYNEQEGHLETFRPYALPEREWLESLSGSPSLQAAKVAGLEIRSA